MTFKTIITKNVLQKDWDNYLCKQDFSTCFQTANYYKPVMLSRDCQTWYITIKDEHDEIVGQLSLLMDFHQPEIDNPITNFILKKFNLGSRITWSHGPIIHDQKNRKKILSEILKNVDILSKKYDIDLISGSSCPLDKQFNETELHNFDYKITPWKTKIVKLNSDSKSLFSSFNKKIRYDIKKANENNLIFEVGTKMSDLIEFTELKFKTRNKIFQYDDESIQQKTWDLYYKENFRKLFLVKFQDELIGGINANIFNGNLYQTSVTNIRNDLNGGTFLTWNAIKWSAENKISFYDFGGFNPDPKTQKEQQIAFYKKKWSGDNYDQQILTKINHPKRQILTKILCNPKLIKLKVLRKIS